MRFIKNKRLFSISMYSIFVFTACLLIWKFVNDFSKSNVFLSALADMAFPFIFASFLAYFINPLVKKIEKYLFGKIGNLSLRRSFSIALSYIIVFGIVIFMLTNIVPELADSIVKISQSLPLYLTTFITFVNVQLVKYGINLSSGDITTLLQDNLSENLTRFTDYTTAILLPNILDITTRLTSTVINIFVAFFISIYLLASKESNSKALTKLIKVFFTDKDAEGIFSVVKESDTIFGKFLIGKFIDSLIIGVITFILLYLFNIPYTLLLSVVVGITNMIPYFGPFIGGIIGFLLLILIDPFKALTFMVLIILIQQFDGNILGPKILGDSTGLSPFWVIFAILIAGKLFGIIGMFLGVPFFAVFKNIATRNIDRMYQLKHPDPPPIAEDDLVDDQSN